MLAKKHKNLYVVGDDAQSLYGFRGADPGLLKRFLREFHARRISLEINYRSCPEIVAAAELLIRKNKHQMKRHIRSERTDTGTVIWKCCANKSEESAYIVDKIKEAINKGIPEKQIAVLGRTYWDLWHIEEAVVRAGIHVCGKSSDSETAVKESHKDAGLQAERKKEYLREGGITITTYHGSKGLEYELVILPEVNEGYVPSPKAVTRAELEEERRMFYVAVTRAKKEILMTSIEMKSGKYKVPSRYLRDMKLLGKKKQGEICHRWKPGF